MKITKRLLTSLCQVISGIGNPVALHDSLTVEPLRTVIFRPGFSTEITGGTANRKIIQHVFIKIVQDVHN